MSEALLRLVEALAQQDAENYLREQTAQGKAPAAPAENPALPATDEAA